MSSTSIPRTRSRGELPPPLTPPSSLKKSKTTPDLRVTTRSDCTPRPTLDLATRIAAQILAPCTSPTELLSECMRSDGSVDSESAARGVFGALSTGKTIDPRSLTPWLNFIPLSGLREVLGIVRRCCEPLIDTVGNMIRLRSLP